MHSGSTVHLLPSLSYPLESIYGWQAVLFRLPKQVPGKNARTVDERPLQYPQLVVEALYPNRDTIQKPAFVNTFVFLALTVHTQAIRKSYLANISPLNKSVAT